MQIVITDNTYIKEIQDEFQKEFPFLKIEFFKHLNKSGNSTQKSQPISGKMVLGTVRHSQSEGALDIDEDRTVEEVENECRSKFGLHSQVFRKSGNMWIETSLTSHWTLRRQNLEGQQMS
jgi:hypothetical protein